MGPRDGLNALKKKKNLLSLPEIAIPYLGRPSVASSLNRLRNSPPFNVEAKNEWRHTSISHRPSWRTHGQLYLSFSSVAERKIQHR